MSMNKVFISSPVDFLGPFPPANAACVVENALEEVATAACVLLTALDASIVGNSGSICQYPKYEQSVRSQPVHFRRKSEIPIKQIIQLFSGFRFIQRCTHRTPYTMPAATRVTKGDKAGKATAGKPYDRQAGAKAEVKGQVNIGAPAQLAQKSRKGKKAWRKNIDVRDEEAAMEQAREEERATG